MTARQQWAVVAAVVAMLVVGAVAATHFLGDELTSLTIGSDAPGFTAATLPDASGRNGVTKSLSDYRGDVVLLNIWATWCEPCRVEMPSMEALHRELAPNGLKVVAVSIDQPGAEAKIKDFIREYGLTFEVLHDSTSAIKTIYRSTGVPESFVIARDGTIRKWFIGAEDWNSVGNRRLLSGLLAEPRP